MQHICKCMWKCLELILHQYLNVAHQSNHMFNLTDQSNQVLYLALDLICLTKRCSSKFVLWLNIFNRPLLIYWCITILCPVENQWTSKFTQWLYTEKAAVHHFILISVLIERLFTLSCTMNLCTIYLTFALDYLDIKHPAK